MTWSPWFSVSQWNLLCLLTAWCSACPWSPRGWSSPSASLCTVWSSLWSRSSECGGGAQSCRRRSLPGLCHLRRLSRCSSDAAWSYDPSPAGPSVWKHTNTLSLISFSSLFFHLIGNASSLFYSNSWLLLLSVSLYLSVSVSSGGVWREGSRTFVPGGKIRLQKTQGHLTPQNQTRPASTLEGHWSTTTGTRQQK